MSVTIREVARATGLSVATISRVLNGLGPVREETRRKVLEEAERLQWVPHGAARALNTKKTKNLGVLLPDMHGEFFSEVIREIDLAARRHDYHVLVSSSHSDPAEMQAVLRALHGRVDGVIVMWPSSAAPRLGKQLLARMPAVLLNGVSRDRIDSLAIDNHGGAVAMMRHLVALGHRRIAFLEGPAGNYDADERLRGYRDVVRAARCERRPEWEIEGDFSEESGFRAGEAFRALRSLPSAVFAANDAMAMGFLSAVQAEGLRVPGDLALAGFDDIPMSRYAAPPLTSVRVPIGALGARAVERLLASLESASPRPPRHETFPTELIVRVSCGAPSQTLRHPISAFNATNVKEKKS